MELSSCSCIMLYVSASLRLLSCLDWGSAWRLDLCSGCMIQKKDSKERLQTVTKREESCSVTFDSVTKPYVVAETQVTYVCTIYYIFII